MEIYAVRIQLDQDYIYKYDDFSKLGFFVRRSVGPILDSFISGLSQRLTNYDPHMLYNFDIDKLPETSLYVFIKGNNKYYLVCSKTTVEMKMTIVNLFAKLHKIEKSENKDELLSDFNRNPSKYHDKIDQINEQTKDVIKIMHVNIDSVLKRGEKISDLMDKAYKLDSHALSFLDGTKKLNRCPCVIL
jgi:hypothetical protein